MAQERLEVRFSPSNAEEKAIIDALDALTEYGAKGRFLKARLLRGFTYMVREMESIKAESDPLAALDRIAHSMDSGSYYALRAMLYPTSDSSATAVAQPAVASVQPAQQASAAPVAQPAAEAAPSAAPAPFSTQVDPVAPAVAFRAPEHVPAAPEAIQIAQVEPDPVRAEIVSAAADPAVEMPAPALPVTEVHVEAVPAQAAEPVAQDAAEEGGGDAEPAPAPVHDWSAFAGLAGTRGSS